MPARRFTQIPRAGDQVYGFVAGLYPTDAPTLPEAERPVQAVRPVEMSRSDGHLTSARDPASTDGRPDLA